jgi:hypothetical protein
MKPRLLPPGLVEALAASKRLTRELQLLQHDCELALSTGSDSDLEMMRSRAFMIQQQIWSLRDYSDRIYDGIKGVMDAKNADAAVPHRRQLTLMGGR